MYLLYPKFVWYAFYRQNAMYSHNLHNSKFQKFENGPKVRKKYLVKKVGMLSAV